MNFATEHPDFKNQIIHDGIKQAAKTRRNTEEYKAIDVRAKFSNLNRALHTQRIEDDYYDNIVYASEAEKRHDQKIRDDLLLARDIDKERNEERLKYKMRQFLRANTPELRELESKLRTAYTTKALLAQMAEKKYMKVKEKESKKRADEMIVQALRSSQEAEQIEKEENVKKQIQYRKELQDQMILNYQLKQQKYEEFLKEKKYLDYIIQRVYDEDQREMEIKLCKMKQTQEEIRAFKEAQKIWKEQRKKELEEENARLIEYMQQKEEEERQRIVAKQKKEEADTKFQEQQCIELYSRLKEKQDRAKIIQALEEEELKQRDIERVEKQFRKKIEDRLKLKEELNYQRKYKEECERQAKLDEIKYREQMWAKLAEEAKLEQLTEERKRREKIAINKKLQEMLVERRVARAEGMKQLLYLDEQERLEQEKRNKIIEEERIRMLKQHAENLIGYFPPGLLRPSDEEHLGPVVFNRETIPCSDIL